jgi:hypothetical protein
MSFRRLLTKVVSLALIVSGLYQIILSLNAIFFIYPNLHPQGQEALIFQEGLVEKALILYASIITTGIYGTILLFKPEEEVKIIHIVFGILIFVGSIFFVVKTPFTTDPVLDYLTQFLLKR